VRFTGAARLNGSWGRVPGGIEDIEGIGVAAVGAAVKKLG
jgi:hypothetical protein